MGIYFLMKRVVASQWLEGGVPSAPPMEWWMYPEPIATAVEIHDDGSKITPMQVNPMIYAKEAMPLAYSVPREEALERARMSRSAGDSMSAIEGLLPVLNSPMWASVPPENQTDVYYELGLNYSGHGDSMLMSDRSVSLQSYDSARYFYQQAISLSELPSADPQFVTLTPYSAQYRLKLVDLGIRQERVYGEPYAGSRLADWRSRTQEVVRCMGHTPQWIDSTLTAGSLFVEISIRMEDGEAANLAVMTLYNMIGFYNRNQTVLSDNKRLNCVAHAADVLDMVKACLIDSDAAHLKPLESDLISIFKDAGVKMAEDPRWQESCNVLRPAISRLWSNPSLKSGQKAMLNSLTPSVGCGCSVS